MLKDNFNIVAPRMSSVAPQSDLGLMQCHRPLLQLPLTFYILQLFSYPEQKKESGL